MSDMTLYGSLAHVGINVILVFKKKNAEMECSERCTTTSTAHSQMHEPHYLTLLHRFIVIIIVKHWNQQYIIYSIKMSEKWKNIVGALN